MLSLQALASLALGTTMMFEAWGYMMPQQDPTDTLILVNKTNKAPTVPVTLVKPNVQPTKESLSENIYMRPEAAAALETAAHTAMIGSEQEVLFEQPKGEYFTGHAKNYTKVYVPAEALHNQVRRVRVCALHADGVLAELLSE